VLSVTEPGREGDIIAAMAQTISFGINSAARHMALALVYDLEGFSKFVNQPDVDLFVPRFFNHVSSAIATVIYGGFPYWLPEEEREEWGEFREPVHEKYLGDGALYIWTFSANDPLLLRPTLDLCNRLRLLARHFATVAQTAYDLMPIVELPRRIRFGLAFGEVYELERTGVQVSKEYAGVCINLASRLQGYCPQVTFAASARLIPGDTADLQNHGYVRVIAPNIKGFGSQAVILDLQQYQSLDAKTRTEYFAEE